MIINEIKQVGETVLESMMPTIKFCKLHHTFSAVLYIVYIITVHCIILFAHNSKWNPHELNIPVSFNEHAMGLHKRSLVFDKLDCNMLETKTVTIKLTVTKKG